MRRVSSRWSWVLVAAAAAVLSARPAVATPSPDFVPGLRSQIPPAVKGTYGIFIPEIAIVIDHSSSMVENIETGRADFVSGEVFIDSPDVDCADADACRCTSAALPAGSTLSAATVIENQNNLGILETLGNPYHMYLYCRDDTLYPPDNGSGWLTPEIYDVNASPLPPDLGELNAEYFARIFPDIDFTDMGSSCAVGAPCNLPAGVAVQFDAALNTALGFPVLDERQPDMQNFASDPDGLDNSNDGVDDSALFPFDDPAPPYIPSATNPNPFNPDKFPYVDWDQDYNHAIRKKSASASEMTLFRRSKVRSAVCAVAAFAGLDFNRIGCDEDDLVTGTGSSDDFFTRAVNGQAKLGIFKTNQWDPGWYAPLTGGLSPMRSEKTFRVVDFYPPGADATDPDDPGGGAPCSAGGGDEQCQRSALYMAPDVRRLPALSGVLSTYMDCEGLGRLVPDGYPKTLAASNLAGLDTLLDQKYGVPGGVISIAGVLRDLYNNGAAGLPANSVGAGGFWNNDVSSCSAQNAAILITDGLDSCTGSRCTCTASDAACDALYGAGNWANDSSENRLPGFLAGVGDPPVAPFEPACPSNLAATMHADALKKVQTYVIGLDAGLSGGDKAKLRTIAEAGGTGNYYAAQSFDQLTGALRSVYSNIRNQGEAALPAGSFAIGLAPSNTNLADVVIQAFYQPKSWVGYLYGYEIIGAGGAPALIWEAGRKLHDRDIDSDQEPRRIYTALDKGCDGKISGDQELTRFDLFWDEPETQWNSLLLAPAGPYGGGGACAGVPRKCLDNAHSTGAPFFLDAYTFYYRTDDIPVMNCSGAAGSGTEGLGLTNRDGTPSGLVSWVYGYDTPTANPDCTDPQYIGTASPVCGRDAIPPPVLPLPPAPQSYRSRDILGDGSPWLLGDIVGSSPVVVGPSRSVFTFDKDTDTDGVSDFSEFQAAVRNRPRIVYAGANDGMLHAFNVDGDGTINVRSVSVAAKGGDEAGGEVWAYIPHEVLPKLKRYASLDYGTSSGPNWLHEASVDMTPRIFDAKIYNPGADGSPLWGWRTILVIGGRGGGHYYAAIDITDPTEGITRGASPSLYPGFLWEFSEFNDTGHGPTGAPIVGTAASATACDTLVERTSADPVTGHPECEDNGMDDGLYWNGVATASNGPWMDRLGESWARPGLGRFLGDMTKWALWIPSGPNTRENPTKVAANQDANNDGHGYIWALDVKTGDPLDVGPGAGQPKEVTDACIEVSDQNNNAGPIEFPGPGNPLLSPFRTSPAAADLSPANDAANGGTATDMLYWGDIGGRLWRGKVQSNGFVATSVFFQPEGNNDCDNTDEERPIVATPVLTPQSLTRTAGLANVFVFFSEGSLDFDARDKLVGNFPRDEIMDPADDERAYRLFGAIDVPGSPPTTPYRDKNDEGDCKKPFQDFTPPCGNGNGNGDLEDRTCCEVDDVSCPAVTPDTDPDPEKHNKGGFFVCIETDPSFVQMDTSGPPYDVGEAKGRGRVDGSPFVAAGSVIADIATPYHPSTNECFNGVSSRILVFGYSTGNASNWTLGGGAQQSGGSGSKYYVPPENPVTGSQGASAQNRGAMTAAVTSQAPDFLRYGLVTGDSAVEDSAIPPVPLQTQYWKEVF